MNAFDSVVRVPAKTKEGFYRYWFRFLFPFHKLTEREMEIAACFLKHRDILSKVISDPDILDSVLMSEETKAKIREECDITIPHFQVVIGKLKKAKVIIDNKLNPRFVPKIKEGNDNFKLLLLFDFDNAESNL